MPNVIKSLVKHIAYVSNFRPRIRPKGMITYEVDLTTNFCHKPYTRNT